MKIKFLAHSRFHVTTQSTKAYRYFTSRGKKSVCFTWCRVILFIQMQELPMRQRSQFSTWSSHNGNSQEIQISKLLMWHRRQSPVPVRVVWKHVNILLLQPSHKALLIPRSLFVPMWAMSTRDRESGRVGEIVRERERKRQIYIHIYRERESERVRMRERERERERE